AMSTSPTPVGCGRSTPGTAPPTRIGRSPNGTKAPRTAPSALMASTSGGSTTPAGTSSGRGFGSRSPRGLPNRPRRGRMRGIGLDALGFSPVAGEARLLVGHERRGKSELLVWDVIADTESEIDLGLPGEVSADWYPDGSALLVVHTYQARDSLYRYDFATGS